MKSRRILIVDDEPDITNIFKICLESCCEGLFKVDAFTDATLALSNYRPGLYDLIMLDVRMSNMDGFSMCEKIKSIDAKAKVCFITASEPMYEHYIKENLAKLDKNLFIQKPISIDEFVMQVNKLLEIPINNNIANCNSK
jgi:CheY-like chemotaxis protein